MTQSHWLGRGLFLDPPFSRETPTDLVMFQEGSTLENKSCAKGVWEEEAAPANAPLAEPRDYLGVPLQSHIIQP